MRLLFLSALLSSALGAVVLAAKEPPARPVTGPATKPAASPVNTHCVVEKENDVNPRSTVVYDGKTIGFCCNDCIRDFKKDPRKYLADLK